MLERLVRYVIDEPDHPLVLQFIAPTAMTLDAWEVVCRAVEEGALERSREKLMRGYERWGIADVWPSDLLPELRAEFHSRGFVPLEIPTTVRREWVQPLASVTESGIVLISPDSSPKE